MFVVVYRWHVHPDMEERFRNAWSSITSRFVNEYDSRGSALFRCADNSYVAIARWPDRKTRDRAFVTDSVYEADSAVMKASIQRREPPLELDCVENLWTHDA